MRDLLPATVAVAVAGPDDWVGELLGAEATCLSDRAVASRRRDFTAGRVCARRALAELGVAPVAVPSAPDRSPVWPPGVVGSITHTPGYCAAVASRDPGILSVGIDAERQKELAPGVRRMILLPEELDWCARQPPGIAWPVVFFSAKETVYKVWHPLVGTWLDFHDARLTIDGETGTFVARIDPAKVAAAPAGVTAPATLTGRFAVDGDLVRTAAVLPAG